MTPVDEPMSSRVKLCTLNQSFEVLLTLKCRFICSHVTYVCWETCTSDRRTEDFSCRFHTVLPACFTTGAWLEKSHLPYCFMSIRSLYYKTVFNETISCQKNLFILYYIIEMNTSTQGWLQGSSNSALGSKPDQTHLLWSFTRSDTETDDRHFSRNVLHVMLMFPAGWQLETNGFIV